MYEVFRFICAVSVFQVTSKATGTNMDHRIRPIDLYIPLMDRKVTTGNKYIYLE